MRPSGLLFRMHGDAVKDVAFTVDDCRAIYKVFDAFYNLFRKLLSEVLKVLESHGTFES